MIRRNVIVVCLCVALFSAKELRASWTVSPTSIDFGTQTVGVPPATGMVVTINNTGPTTLTLTTVMIPALFILKSGAVPNTIAANAYSPPNLTFASRQRLPGPTTAQQFSSSAMAPRRQFPCRASPS